MIKFTDPQGEVSYVYPTRVRLPDGYTATGPEVSPSLLKNLGWTIEIIEEPIKTELRQIDEFGVHQEFLVDDANVQPNSDSLGTGP